MAEINVTPMVDVMLVLLIIFMVAGAADDVDHRHRSARRRRRQVARGQRTAADAVGQAHRRACNSNVELYLGDTLISANEPVARRSRRSGKARSEAESVVYLRGDKDVCYTGYDETFGVYSDGGVQGEYRDRAGAGLLSHEGGARTPDGGAGKLR
jgi:biopolymer transport protein ExbD/biopolymer transport protein TolR